MNDPVIRYRPEMRGPRAVAAVAQLGDKPLSLGDKRDLAWFSALLVGMPALILASALALD